MTQRTNDQGSVHLSGIHAGAEAHVRIPDTTSTSVAQVLGSRTVASGCVAVYLDRLIHGPQNLQVGAYSLSGGHTTILTGPPPVSEPC